MKSSLPLVFAFVLTFAFLLLLASFRSLVIAAKAIILNLLSVAAAYGVVVATFQYGWGQHLLNFKPDDAIVPWLPLFMFVILFGLSMDYHVFILSRVREAYDRGMSTEDAVAHGIKTTAGTVTSAAIVMVAGFSIFATLPILEMKEMGIGLATAVLLDATIVRGLLLPASMKLLGELELVPTQLAQLATKARTPHRAQTRASPSIRLTTHRPTPHHPGPPPRPGSHSADNSAPLAASCLSQLTMQVSEHREHAPVRFRCRRQAELLKDVRDVLLDRALGHHDPLGDRDI